MSRASSMSNLKARSISGLTGLILVSGCSQRSGQDDGGMDSVSTPGHVQFVDVSEEAGLDFENVSGGPTQMYVLESMSAGAAFLDYDVDGWLDLFVVNGTRLDGPVEGATNRLFHNRAAPGRQGEQRRVFREVTEEAGVGHTGWGMGCAVGDYDNDGDPDLYVTYWGPNRLYRNDGDGGFVEFAESAGVADERWGSSAAFGDVDGDGFVDLYVTNYLEFDLANPPGAGLYKGLEVMAGPNAVPHQPDVLYRNNKDGSFTDMSAATGLDRVAHPGLGVVFGDYDDDGDLDIYVANDTAPNLLLRNDGDWQLSEVGVVAGVAYSEDGRSQAGMGVASGDYDNDGDLDLVVSNFSDDVNTLYQNQGEGTFVDMTFAAGLFEMVRPLLCWSNGFFDYDNDGWLDLFTACGHLYPQLEQYPSGMRYGQRNLIYHNEHGRYAEVGRETGPGWAIAKVTRAAALGDYDNDGDVDVLLMNLNDKPSLLRNDGGNGNNWFGLQLEGVQSNRDAIGARVRVVAGTLAQVREVHRGYGFQSQHDPRLIFGLGGNERVDRVEIRWPSGTQQVLEDPQLRNYLVVREGVENVIATYAGPGAKHQPVAIDVTTSAPEPESEEPSAYVVDASLTADEHYARGTGLYDQGRHEEALGLLRGAIQLRPDYMEAYYALGVTLHAGLGRPLEAASVLEEAVQRDSSWAGIQALLGAVYLGLNEPERAIESLQRSIALDPSPWQSYARMGLAYLRLRNTAAAEKAFKRAVTVAPYAPAPHLQLVRVYEIEAQREESAREQRIFERLQLVQDRVDLYADKIKQYADVAEWHYRLGRAYVKQGRYDEALSSFAKAVKLDPGHGMAHYGMGAAFHYKGYLTRAIEAYIKAGQVDPSLVEALSDLGRAYFESGLLEAAVQAYQQAIRLRPGLAPTISNLGEVYAAQGKMDEAIDAYRAALEVDSTLSGTRRHLERLLSPPRR